MAGHHINLLIFRRWGWSGVEHLIASRCWFWGAFVLACLYYTVIVMSIIPSWFLLYGGSKRLNVKKKLLKSSSLHCCNAVIDCFTFRTEERECFHHARTVFQVSVSVITLLFEVHRPICKPPILASSWLHMTLVTCQQWTPAFACLPTTNNSSLFASDLLMTPSSIDFSRQV